MAGRASGVKMMWMAEMGAPISLDGVAVHPDCWCVCPCYLHFAPENPEHGTMYLLVTAHPGCPRQSPESCKMVVRACVCVSNNPFNRTDSEKYFYRYPADWYILEYWYLTVAGFIKEVCRWKQATELTVLCCLDSVRWWRCHNHE